MEENDFVSIWLEESGNPAIEELSALNREIASETAKMIAEKVFSITDLSIALDINADEINRWLLNRHTFSSKTINHITALLASNM